MRPPKASIGVFATAVVLLPPVTVSPDYADKPDDLSSDTTPISDQAAPEINGSLIEEREATPVQDILAEFVGDPLPTPEDGWAPANEADDIAVPSDSNAPEQARAPLPSDRLVPTGKQGTANRAPAGTPGR